MTDIGHHRIEAWKALTATADRADARQVGEIVKYPSIHGDQIIEVVGTIESIECLTPDAPYVQRVLEFTFTRAFGARDRLRVAPDYRGITVFGG